jgi:peptidoglycan/xylan/chitin deacetylase (PgdA/CDA1 family)
VNALHPRDRLSVPPSAFEAQLQEISRSGSPILALEDGVAALASGARPHGVALTFDDGYEDNVTVALPMLERSSLRATFFLATSAVASRAPLDRYRGCCEGDAMMSWEQARHLAARGHTLGGHGRAHVELTGLPPEALREEIEGSAVDIEEATGRRPHLFCYPRGREDARVRAAVAATGYTAAVTVRPGSNAPGGDPFALRRTEVSGEDDIEDFRLKLMGAFDGWHRLVQLLGGRKLHR